MDKQENVSISPEQAARIEKIKDLAAAFFLGGALVALGLANWLIAGACGVAAVIFFVWGFFKP
jgi:hypothetical protein